MSTDRIFAPARSPRQLERCCRIGLQAAPVCSPGARSWAKRQHCCPKTLAVAQPHQAHGMSADPTAGRRVTIIGAGWAGFGAAKHLSEQGYRVTLIDGSPNPGGLSAGWRTEQGRAVEAGTKGFWYQYGNIFSLVRELGIPWPFTDWTTSGFWSPRGLTIEAPVFSQKTQFPALIGQFIHTFPLFRTLPLTERVTMLPWLYSILDFDATSASYEAYDRMSARDMFERFGVSKRMYEEFVKPTLLVGLFAPPEELSAAAVIECLYFYALAHQNDFDVCWCKGSVAERIFEPLITRITAAGGNIVGGRFVTDVQIDRSTGLATGVTSTGRDGQEHHHETDALVFSVGITGMQKLISSCPALAERQEFQRIMNLSGLARAHCTAGLDVIATRLWLDRKVDTRFPANVLSGFDDTMGSTYFNLNQLQDEYRDEPGTVIASDFYHSNTLMPLSDEAIIARVQSNLVACEPQFAGAQVVDSKVLRFPKAVTHFSPGSHASRPRQQTSLPNVFMAGDWVRGLQHGANGLSQERAYVAGLAAANLVVRQLGQGQQAHILPVQEDEPHIAAARQANRAVKRALEAVLPARL